MEIRCVLHWSINVSPVQFFRLLQHVMPAIVVYSSWSIIALLDWSSVRNRVVYCRLDHYSTTIYT